MPGHEWYMRRCLELAAKGLGQASPNPLVGAVLVHEERILSEGWHARYGGPHAEVNCLDAVPANLRHLIPASTLYVSLEPCCHTGKTPPCTLRIIQEKIPKVVVAMQDPFPAVGGKGLQALQDQGIGVETGILEAEAQFLNRRFLSRVEKQRPYIILKWAVSADGFIGRPNERVKLSSAYSDRLVHRWRSEEDAICVGYQTVMTDDPLLNVRHYPGRDPLRVIWDPHAAISSDKHIFEPGIPTRVYHQAEDTGKTLSPPYIALPAQDPLSYLLQDLAQSGISSLLVEGGARTHQAFLDAGLADEIRVIETPAILGEGIKAAHIPPGFILREQTPIGPDILSLYIHRS